MNYLELHLTVSPDFNDILIAELGELGFESFTEEADGLNAYILEDQFDADTLQTLLAQYSEQTELYAQTRLIEKQNWNETWEQNYQPIEVAGQVRVRASFHPKDPSFAYEIEINPKMSFGTGHHETTALMLEHQLSLEHLNKTVLDVGSGTGILAIMASLRGASEVSAFDIEEWAAENARENVALNHCQNIAVRQGTIETEPHQLYDIVLANINRNILLREIPIYATFAKPQATLAVSGFYEQDIAEIEEVANEQGFVKTATKTRNGWAAVVFERNLG
ncbi:MAG: 50S ribosomal protein L11 methyltransferase [Spirosomataceae bacterium]